MNETPPRVRAVLIAMAVLGAACRSDPGPPPLAGATLGGPFALVGQDGRRVSDRDFAGKYLMVYFGFTHCPDVCPVDLQRIGAALRRFESSDPARAARVQPLFITVDPARDRPETIRAYVRNFHPRLVGLTGSEAEIARVARAYGIYSQRGEPAGPAGGYAVDHSRNTLLYGPDRKPIVILPVEQGPDAIAAALDEWVR